MQSFGIVSQVVAQNISKEWTQTEGEAKWLQ